MAVRRPNKYGRPVAPLYARCHEAAHAVVAVYHRVPVKYVTSEVCWIAGCSEPNQEQLRAMIRVGFAGDIATSRVDGSPIGDSVSVKDWILILEALQELHPGVDVDAPQSRKLRDQLQHETGVILESPLIWAAVEAVAEGLGWKDELSGAEVRRVFRRALASSSTPA